MKYIKVTGCKTCLHQEYHKCTLLGCMVSKYILEKTIHPNCPLEDMQDATKNIKAVWEDYKSRDGKQDHFHPSWHYEFKKAIEADGRNAGWIKDE